jgi:hypothetical protein
LQRHPYSNHRPEKDTAESLTLCVALGNAHRLNKQKRLSAFTPRSAAG